MKKKHKISLLSDSHGYTLIEVMVAITLLVIVIIPLASFYAASLGTIQRSMLYSQAMQLARERIELCESLDYDSLYYWNPVFTPGFEFTNQINSNRDPFGDDDIFSYDPLDINDDGYPIPIYRDYYCNRTGRLLDPNYNGLCDADLNGNGRYGVIDGDMDDVAVCSPTGRRWTDYAPLNELPQYMQDFAARYGADSLFIAGDGYYDTVVEGIYANAFDPALYGTRHLLRDNNSREQVSPIIDFSLQIDPKHLSNYGIPDYRHREQTFRTFARMTTIIDPTPTLKNPNVRNPSTYHYADGLAVMSRMINDGWTEGQVQKFIACSQRDMPFAYGIENLSVGVESQGLHTPEDFDLIVTNPFTHNYYSDTPLMMGKKVIVTVFYLSGKGERADLSGDGFPDGETFSTSNSVRLERIFYNNNLLGGPMQSIKPPVSRFDLSYYQNTGHLRPAVSGSLEDKDPCSFENGGLPYLDDDWPDNI